ncbi:hypothetical protein SAMN05216299_11247 [Nitrosospira sp. Nsp14]|nr:hypothetical protein SAMN05216299_11247 [Nitrosospira sp. Nsp14]
MLLLEKDSSASRACFKIGDRVGLSRQEEISVVAAIAATAQTHLRYSEDLVVDLKGIR